jgi:3-oxoacyl-[acyl-carrier-protein] synthase II
MATNAAPRRVAVTGYGAICSLGNTSEEIWNSILQYKIGYKTKQYDDPSIGARFFGFIDPDKKIYAGFSKSILKMLPEFAKYSLVAAREALEMAFGQGFDLDNFVSPLDRGVIIGTGWGGVDRINTNYNDYFSTGFATSFGTLMSMNNVGTAAVSMNWNMRGYQNTPIAACATGSIAIGDAAEVIRSGRATVMLAGGSESLKHIFNVWLIDVTQALTQEAENPRRACCPFSQYRNGFVLSEGAAILCLEDMEHARQRNARILGEITGYGNFSDAYDMTAPAADLRARVQSIRSACDQAGRLRGDIDYINAHGTSTRLNDTNETESIKEVFGNNAYNIPISSTKSYTGHLIGAAGSLEAIFCLKAIETGIIPATIHYDEADPICDLDYVPNEHRHIEGLQTALNLSFGFGGANAAIIFERAGAS